MTTMAADDLGSAEKAASAVRPPMRGTAAAASASGPDPGGGCCWSESSEASAAHASFAAPQPRGHTEDTGPRRREVGRERETHKHGEGARGTTARGSTTTTTTTTRGRTGRKRKKREGRGRKDTDAVGKGGGYRGEHREKSVRGGTERRARTTMGTEMEHRRASKPNQVMTQQSVPRD